jgi:TRAP-type C4-dicarboxylate transport system permease small subunit
VSTELIVSICALVVEVGLFVLMYLRSKKPPVPGEVRIFPYAAGMTVMIIVILLTLAHIVSLLTGTQVQPRKPRGMR